MKREREVEEECDPQEDATTTTTSATKEMTTTTVKPKMPAQVGPGISSLPASVLAYVWSFAVNTKTSDGICENASEEAIQMRTYELKGVCRAWRSGVEQLICERLHNVAVLDMAQAAAKAKTLETTPPASDKLVLVMPMDKKLTQITDLRVTMGDIMSNTAFKDQFMWADDEQAFHTVRVVRNRAFFKGEIPEIDWEKTLSPFGPQITRLDLIHMLIYTPHLGELLQAASKLCPNVKQLLLPTLEKKYFRKEEIRGENMVALSGALKAWHESNGGLTHLCVPYLGMDPLMILQYITDLTSYCPQLEYLDGEKFSFLEQCNLEFVTCEHFWITPVQIFQSFWQKCSKLKRFNTVILPFSERFFSVLAENGQIKMDLEELVISHNTLLFRDTEGLDGELFCKMMANFPALRKLEVVFGDEGNSFDWGITDLFDDEFLEAVSKCNPLLEKLTIRSRGELYCITSPGLAILLQMPKLKRIQLQTLCCLDENTEDCGFISIFDKMIQDKKQVRLRLTVEVTEDLMWQVLDKMTQIKPEQLVDVSFSLSLQTKETFGHVVPEMEETNGYTHSQEEVEELYEEVKRIHGSAVRVHLHTTLPPDDGDEEDEEEEEEDEEERKEPKKKVLFDSLELSINDPQGFCCLRDKCIAIGNNDIEQELCGEEIRVDGVFERDPEGALEDVEMAEYWKNKRIRQFHITGLLSDDEDDGGSDEDGNDQLDGLGGVYFDDGEGEDEFDEEDDEEDEGDDETGEGDD